VHLMVQCMEAWFLADKQALTLLSGREASLKPLSRIIPTSSKFRRPM
jgi:hypothetical protein